MLAALLSAGIKAYLRKDGRQIVMSTRFPNFPNDSNSFWLTFDSGHWYVVTFAPQVYQIPKAVDVVRLCTICLGCSNRAIAAVPAGIIQEFNLTLLSDKEMTKISG